MSTKPTVMHIHFWADIRNSAGSVEKVITAFAAHGQRFDHRIACCPAGGPSRQPPFRHHGVEVHLFHENLLLNRIANKMLGRGVFTYGSLARLINGMQPSILHFHNRQELVDALVGRLAYRPRVVVHYHRHFAQPVIPRSAHLLVFISNATAADIMRKTHTTTPHCVVANPLSMELLEHALQGTTREHPGSPPVILFGGGASPIKGGRELIDAFLGLPTGSARMVVAGHGVEAFDVRHSAIELIGRVSAADFLARMQLADIVAMPSYDEPFGLIAQEALLMGKLLVTTASGGLAEFVDEQCAVLVRPRDTDSLRCGLSRALALLGRPEDLAQMRSHARERVAAHAPAKVAIALEKCYDLIFDET